MPPKQGKRLNWIEHLLLRPDTKIGSVKCREAKKWIYDAQTDRMVYRSINHNTAFEQIHVEAISNAIDNRWRSDEAHVNMTTIRISVNATTGTFTIRNDGAWIPVERLDWTYRDPDLNTDVTSTMYPVEVYFGHDLSGTNYDDSEDRTTSGRNGIGIKTTVVFSKEFRVSCGDPALHKQCSMTFSNNLSSRSEVSIEPYRKHTSGFTEVSFVPDFERFGVEGYTEEWIGLLKFHAYNCSMITGMKVYFNDELIKARTLVNYAKLFLPDATNCFALKSADCDVVIAEQSEATALENGFMHVAFTNGAHNRDGGVHVEAWQTKLLDQIRDAVNTPQRSKGKKKDDLPPVKISRKDIEQYFILFINAKLSRPEFDNQFKHTLTHPKPRITKTELLTDAQLLKIRGWNFVYFVEEMINTRVARQIKRTDGGSSRVSLGSKADDANWAGTKNRNKCGLILTEGGSAKASATAGVSILPDGKDRYGILALRGKLINAVKVSARALNANAEVQYIKKLIGLEHGVDYSSDEQFSKLRYGDGVYLFCDADVDGAHIEGLVANLFYNEYPGLSERGYIRAIRTPVVKVTTPTKVLEFYRDDDYREWQNTTDPKIVARSKPKYYKGLATLTIQEVKEYFRKLKYITYTFDGESKELMNLGFGDASEERKQWIGSYDANALYENDDGSTFSPYREIVDGPVLINDFIHHRLILYALESIQRAIPSVYDGLKVSQRKILMGMFMRTGNKPAKIEQLAGYIGSETHYHHGQVSIQEAMGKMGQGFVGSNNIPLLMNIGMFGTRIGKADGKGKIKGGADAGASRYIETKLDPCARRLFPCEDDELLEHNTEDGKRVEPKFYVPILPLILINGADGIGMGWSSTFPQCNPLDLCAWERAWIDAFGGDTFDPCPGSGKSAFPDLHPWYRNFTGTITKLTNRTYVSSGIMEKDAGKKERYHVRELPVGLWTASFKLVLEDLEKEGLLRFTDYCTESKIHFVIDPHKTFLPDDKTNLKCLHKRISLSNMVALDRRGFPRKYDTLHSVMEEFCGMRMDLYVGRLANEIQKTEHSLTIERNRMRFIREVLDKTLVVFNRDEEELFAEMEKKLYDRESDKYDYLVNMQIRSMTKQRLEDLQRRIDGLDVKLASLRHETPQHMWLCDLDAFEAEYTKFLTRRVD
uniref:DNA topoisomerase (ATP-hydrolyzing) n=1 Tax=viral metagenome TaxID=1070528 RepID=A0A6C0M1R5_9ZZZZ